jgi:hypothetical protein
MPSFNNSVGIIPTHNIGFSYRIPIISIYSIYSVQGHYRVELTYREFPVSLTGFGFAVYLPTLFTH